MKTEMGWVIFWRTLYTLLSICALASLGMSFYLLYRDLPDHDWRSRPISWEESAARSDFWNGHLSLGFAGGGTILLVITLLMQRQELVMQRKELELQRQHAKEELSHSRSAAMVSTIISFVGLYFDSDLRLARAEKDNEQDIAKQHVAAIQASLSSFLENDELPDDLRDLVEAVLGE